MARQTFYFSDGPYLQAMQGLHAALSGSEAFVKFIGQPRTGKSGVCEKLTQFMRLKDYRVIYFDYPVESPDMLRSMLAKKLDIPDSFNFLRHLEDAQVLESEKPLVILFDDAHLLSDITLIDIYRLASVQVQQKRVINIVLCGEPELERRLSSKQEFTALLQHVSHNFLLEPMDATTTAQFLVAFLEKMNVPGLQLEQAAINQFYKSSRGFPGPAYSLCQLILSIRQGSQQLDSVTKDELLLAIRNADSEQPVSSSMLREGGRWMLLAPIVAVVVIASLALLLRQLRPSQLEPEVERSVSLAAENSAPAAVLPSPFALDELPAVSSTAIDAPAQAEEGDASTAVEANSGAPQAEQRPEAVPVVEIEIPVSDSNLALVTAQERGISNEAITEPLFEQMESDAIASSAGTQPSLSVIDESAPNGDVAQFPAVTLTRPMLALDDEESPIPEEVVEPEASEVSAELIAEAAPVEADIVPASSPESVAQETPVVSAPQQMVQAWLGAWEGKDLEKYFASYDESFVPRYHRSKSAWRSNRERVIGNARQIRLELSDFVVISEDAESIEVHFWLAYRSPSYRDDTHKKLILKKLPASGTGLARLVILEEINLEVRV